MKTIKNGQYFGLIGFLALMAVAFAACEGPVGPAGAAGTNGNDGSSFVWMGTYANEAALIAVHGEPKDGWAYYNTTQGKALIYYSLATPPWQTLAADGANGSDGTNGNDGASFVWKGTYANQAAFTSANGAAQEGWAYYDQALGESLIYSNGAWHTLAADGSNGNDGSSFVWKGTYISQTAFINANGTPQNGWAYYDQALGQSRIYSNGVWYTLAADGSHGNNGNNGNDGQDGQDGTIFLWKGTYADLAEFEAENGTAQDGWAYYDEALGQSRIYSSGAWHVLAANGTNGEDGTNGQDGNDGQDGAVFTWKGTYTNEAALIVAQGLPQDGWAYYDEALGQSRIYSSGAWHTLAANGADGKDGEDGTDGTDGQDGTHGTNGKDGDKGDSGNIVINISGSGGNADISAAIEQAIAAAQLLNDGSSADKALNLAFTGFSVEDDVAMKIMYLGIEGYWVNLDLSGLSGRVFAYNSLAVNIDKSRIRTLTLPDTVTTIRNGINYYDSSVFYGFTGLSAVSGAGVLSIGNYAFTGFPSTSLAAVDFPVAQTIGNYAFYDCRSLTAVDFPAAQTIGSSAFYDCRSLAAVNLPEAQTIGDSAFYQCTSLAAVELPAVTSLGNNVFQYTGSQALSVTLGPAAPLVGTTTFSNVSVAKEVTVLVPLGATGYVNDGDAIPFSVSSGTDEHWGNAFRGLGWDGTSYLGGTGYYSGTINQNVSLTIEYLQ